ncbi:MAG: hypothetical protein KFF50_05125 [Desulfatitalea sp.]|nr:hypothetical protein [Desulfatitalea sp.]
MVPSLQVGPLSENELIIGPGRISRNTMSADQGPIGFELTLQMEYQLQIIFDQRIVFAFNNPNRHYLCYKTDYRPDNRVPDTRECLSTYESSISFAIVHFFQVVTGSVTVL